MMLTEANKTNAYPAATMETALSSVEESLYYNLNTTRADKPSGYPTDTSYSNPNLKLAKTNGNGNIIGPAIVLKVMAGDKFNLRVSSWYKLNGVSPGTPQDPITALITALSGGIGALAGAKATAGELISTNILSGPAQSFLNSQSGYTTSKPKAFVNWILFDEQFKYVSSSSGFEQVGTDQQFKVHQFSGQNITKNGYLYIYVSNETPNVDVYFDNLQVTHVRGPVLEESHFYPFGLTMHGISSKVLSAVHNTKKYNAGSEYSNGEFINGDGLEIYDTYFRSLDPQIGRWWQIDPHCEYHLSTSPYSYVLNNPMLYNDPLGLDTVRTKLVDGKMSIPTNPDKATVLEILNEDGSMSYYTYDPENPDANSQGYVGGGLKKKDNEENITIKSSTREERERMKRVYGLDDFGVFLLTTGMSAGEFFAYNDIAWYSVSQLKFYNHKFHGNQYTAGGRKGAARIKSRLGRLGSLLAIYNAYDINNKYQNSEIGYNVMIIEQTSNVISSLGWVGAAWGVGWELGRGLTSIPWYRANIRPLIQDALGVERDE